MSVGSLVDIPQLVGVSGLQIGMMTVLLEEMPIMLDVPPALPMLVSWLLVSMLLLLPSSMIMPMVDNSSSTTGSPSPASAVLRPLSTVNPCTVRLPVPDPPLSTI